MEFDNIAEDPIFQMMEQIHGLGQNNENKEAGPELKSIESVKNTDNDDLSKGLSVESDIQDDNIMYVTNEVVIEETVVDENFIVLETNENDIVQDIVQSLETSKKNKTDEGKSEITSDQTPENVLDEESVINEQFVLGIEEEDVTDEQIKENSENTSDQTTEILSEETAEDSQNISTESATINTKEEISNGECSEEIIASTSCEDIEISQEESMRKEMEKVEILSDIKDEGSENISTESYTTVAEVDISTSEIIEESITTTSCENKEKDQIDTVHEEKIMEKDKIDVEERSENISTESNTAVIEVEISASKNSEEHVATSCENEEIDIAHEEESVKTKLEKDKIDEEKSAPTITEILTDERSGATDTKVEISSDKNSEDNITTASCKNVGTDQIHTENEESMKKDLVKDETNVDGNSENISTESDTKVEISTEKDSEQIATTSCKNVETPAVDTHEKESVKKELEKDKTTIEEKSDICAPTITEILCDKTNYTKVEISTRRNSEENIASTSCKNIEILQVDTVHEQELNSENFSETFENTLDLYEENIQNVSNEIEINEEMLKDNIETNTDIDTLHTLENNSSTTSPNKGVIFSAMEEIIIQTPDHETTSCMDDTAYTNKTILAKGTYEIKVKNNTLEVYRINMSQENTNLSFEEGTSTNNEVDKQVVDEFKPEKTITTMDDVKDFIANEHDYIYPEDLEECEECNEYQAVLENLEDYIIYKDGDKSKENKKIKNVASCAKKCKQDKKHKEKNISKGKTNKSAITKKRSGKIKEQQIRPKINKISESTNVELTPSAADNSQKPHYNAYFLVSPQNLPIAQTEKDKSNKMEPSNLDDATKAKLAMNLTITPVKNRTRQHISTQTSKTSKKTTSKVKSVIEKKYRKILPKGMIPPPKRVVKIVPKPFVKIAPKPSKTEVQEKSEKQVETKVQIKKECEDDYTLLEDDKEIIMEIHDNHSPIFEESQNNLTPETNKTGNSVITEEIISNTNIKKEEKSQSKIFEENQNNSEPETNTSNNTPKKGAKKDLQESENDSNYTFFEDDSEIVMEIHDNKSTSENEAENSEVMEKPDSHEEKTPKSPTKKEKFIKEIPDNHDEITPKSPAKRGPKKKKLIMEKSDENLEESQNNSTSDTNKISKSATEEITPKSPSKRGPKRNKLIMEKPDENLEESQNNSTSDTNKISNYVTEDITYKSPTRRESKRNKLILEKTDANLKESQNQSASETNKISDSIVEIIPKSPSKRGRKKKQILEKPDENFDESENNSASETSKINSCVTEEITPKSPAKRGRKKKQILEKSDTNFEESASETNKMSESIVEITPKSPAKRGRKKKQILEKSDTNFEKSENQSASDTNKMSDSVTVEVTPKSPTKRGRKRKQILEKSDTNFEESQNQSASETNKMSDSITEEITPKSPKKRGRKRKQILEKSDTNFEENQNQSASETNKMSDSVTEEITPKSPKKRGRKRKQILEKSDTNFEENQNQSTSDTNKISDSITEEITPKSPSKRGRKRNKQILEKSDTNFEENHSVSETNKTSDSVAEEIIPKSAEENHSVSETNKTSDSVAEEIIPKSATKKGTQTSKFINEKPDTNFEENQNNSVPEINKISSSGAEEIASTSPTTKESKRNIMEKADANFEQSQNDSASETNKVSDCFTEEISPKDITKKETINKLILEKSDTNTEENQNSAAETSKMSNTVAEEITPNSTSIKEAKISQFILEPNTNLEENQNNSTPETSKMSNSVAEEITPNSTSKKEAKRSQFILEPDTNLEENQNNSTPETSKISNSVAEEITPNSTSKKEAKRSQFILEPNTNLEENQNNSTPETSKMSNSVAEEITPNSTSKKEAKRSQFILEPDTNLEENQNNSTTETSKMSNSVAEEITFEDTQNNSEAETSKLSDSVTEEITPKSKKGTKRSEFIVEESDNESTIIEENQNNSTPDSNEMSNCVPEEITPKNIAKKVAKRCKSIEEKSDNESTIIEENQNNSISDTNKISNSVEEITPNKVLRIVLERTIIDESSKTKKLPEIKSTTSALIEDSDDDGSYEPFEYNGNDISYPDSDYLNNGINYSDSDSPFKGYPPSNPVPETEELFEHHIGEKEEDISELITQNQQAIDNDDSIIVMGQASDERIQLMDWSQIETDQPYIVIKEINGKNKKSRKKSKRIQIIKTKTQNNEISCIYVVNDDPLDSNITKGNSNDKRQMKCNFCDMSFVRPKHLVRHLKQKHPREIRKTEPPHFKYDDDSQKEIKENEIYLSHTVFKGRKISQKLKNLLYKHEKAYMCNVCEYNAHGFRLEKHLVSHTNDKPFTCKFCRLKFRFYKNLASHYKTVHPNIFREFISANKMCEHCNIGFESDVKLHQHMFMKHIRTSARCKFCTKIVNHEKIYEHLRTHRRNVDVYCCDFCEDIYLTKDLFLKHRRTHIFKKVIDHSENKTKVYYKCNRCGNNYASEKYLDMHLKNNDCKVKGQDEDLNFECKYCNKHFSSLHNLKLHSDSLLCQQNKKAYLDKQNQNKEKNETNKQSDQPRNCQLCERCFPRELEYIRHMKEAHGYILNSCEKCNRNFPNRVTLQNHVKYCGLFTKNTELPTKTQNYYFTQQKSVSESEGNYTEDDQMEEKIELACDQCKQTFKKSQELELHKVHCKKEKDFNNEQSNSAVPQIETEKKENEEITKHQLEKRNSEDLNVQENSEKSEVSKLQCDRCNKIFKRIQGFIVHKMHCKKIPNSIVPQIKCDRCNKIFKRKQGFVIHKIYCKKISNSTVPQIKENGENKEKTEHNTNQLEKRDSEDSGMDKIEENILYKCEYCNKTVFKENLGLEVHKIHCVKRTDFNIKQSKKIPPVILKENKEDVEKLENNTNHPKATNFEDVPMQEKIKKILQSYSTSKQIFKKDDKNDREKELPGNINQCKGSIEEIPLQERVRRILQSYSSSQQIKKNNEESEQQLKESNTNQSEEMELENLPLQQRLNRILQQSRKSSVTLDSLEETEKSDESKNKKLTTSTENKKSEIYKREENETTGKEETDKSNKPGSGLRKLYEQYMKESKKRKIITEKIQSVKKIKYSSSESDKEKQKTAKLRDEKESHHSGKNISENKFVSSSKKDMGNKKQLQEKIPKETGKLPEETESKTNTSFVVPSSTSLGFYSERNEMESKKPKKKYKIWESKNIKEEIIEVKPK